MIQQHWRAFVHDRTGDPDAARAIARTIGEPVVDMNAFFNFNLDGRIVVQVNGVSGAPTQGHSAFYVHDAVWHLVIAFPDNLAAMTEGNRARYPVPNAFEGVGGAYAGITCNGRDMWCFMPDFASKITHLTAKGAVFALHERYARHFHTAFHLERVRFRHRPFSYGLHYNCNTFVRCVLERIVQLAAS